MEIGEILSTASAGNGLIESEEILWFLKIEICGLIQPDDFEMKKTQDENKANKLKEIIMRVTYNGGIYSENEGVPAGSESFAWIRCQHSLNYYG